MGYRKCCVSGCKSTSDTHCLYRFPRDSALRKLWIHHLAPQNSTLLMLSDYQLLSRTVCQLHFESRMFDVNGKKLPKAYPCLFSKQEISCGMPLVTGCGLNEEHNYCKRADNVDEDVHPSESIFILRSKENTEHQYTKIPTTSIEGTSFAEKQDLPKTQPLISGIPSADISSNFANLVEDKLSTLTIVKHKQKVLSPKRKISAKNRRFSAKIITMSKNSIGENSASRVQQAQDLSVSELMNDFHKLNNHTKTFIKMQLKSVRSGKAPSYNLQEKLLCLTIMKHSRKNYKLLQKMFALPSQRTLSRLSEKIIIDTGINENIIAAIKEKSKKWNRTERLCSIVFDEVSMKTNLNFNEKKDVIYGFCDIAGDRKMKYCDHALVVMIRGICSSWRQPLAYYFCEGTTAAVDIKNILKEVVSKVAESGLTPLALICDQGSTFRTTMNQFRQETMKQRNMANIADDGTINISGHDLSIIYDPPHLIKGIRYNFLTKDMVFQSKIAKWNDILTIYEIDSTIGIGHSRALPKITKHHVDKDSIPKMRVSVATKVLSARVAAMLRYADAVVKHKDGGSLSPTMSTTADAVEFFDKLFDSVNGRPGDAPKGKLRTAVKESTSHLSFWQEAKKKVMEINFLDKSGKNAYVPSLRGWITTLDSMIRIAKLLFSEYKVEFFYPRYLNQDPLENFFGRLRANNYRNVIPDANAFEYSFKSLVLSNILTPLSKFSNCEEDEGEQLITLEILLKNTTNTNSKDENKENISPYPKGANDNDDLPPAVLEKIRVHCSAYVAGYLCRKIIKATNCSQCGKTLSTKEVAGVHKYISYREYKTLKKSNLAYPSEKMIIIYRKCSQIIHNYLNEYCFKKNVGTILKKILKNQCSFEWMGCSDPLHKLLVQELFLKIIIRLQVHNWVKIINKILRGAVEEKYVKKMEAPQIKALLKFNKHKRQIKNRS